MIEHDTDNSRGDKKYKKWSYLTNGGTSPKLSSGWPPCSKEVETRVDPVLLCVCVLVHGEAGCSPTPWSWRGLWPQTPSPCWLPVAGSVGSCSERRRSHSTAGLSVSSFASVRKTDVNRCYRKPSHLLHPQRQVCMNIHRLFSFRFKQHLIRADRERSVCFHQPVGLLRKLVALLLFLLPGNRRQNCCYHF